MKSHGFRTVINLLTEAEGARHEEAAVTAQGLRHVWVPVTPQSFCLEDVRR